ncbi:MAG: class I SAM-dependent methyltransferase [Euryarchaeota archaeon]|nr:class I SAM-dependent methyltransferase [Euryarchaeota archaeon]
METELRERHAPWGTFPWPEWPDMFLERLAAEDFSDATVLDLGTGEGRLALYLAPRATRVVGIDTDEVALDSARRLARERGLSNVNFFAANADEANYRLLVRSPIDYVVASYFMSEEAIANAAKGVRSGGKFLFACHHPDNWIESGRVGRFSFGEGRMEVLLTANGFRVEFLGVDRLVVVYENLDALAAAHPALHEKFRGDGRWSVLSERDRDGPVDLTWATLVGVALRP